MSSPENASRLHTELELLEAMYPSQTSYNSRSREFKYQDPSGGLLHLRIPERYPDSSMPEILSASDASKKDLRDAMKAAVRQLGLAEGEEALDAVVACFQSMLDDDSNDDSHADADGTMSKETQVESQSSQYKTVIIWLHHLLAQSKRKLAISPSLPLRGISKPGYPGIMIFSGAADAVNEHVDTLKAENWQAFQVRYEELVLWEFGHEGVVEVETMAEVVRRVEVGELKARRKEEIMGAVGIK